VEVEVVLLKVVLAEQEVYLLPQLHFIILLPIL
jgi:hypothetical protein